MALDFSDIICYKVYNTKSILVRKNPLKVFAEEAREVQLYKTGDPPHYALLLAVSV